MSTPKRSRRSSREDGVWVEEQFEADKHQEIYSRVRDRDLTMRSDDWEKFEGGTVPHRNPYYHSVLSLGDIQGKTVLDVGCGDGWLSVILAKRGAAHVDAFDISSEAVRLARTRARVNGVSDRVTVEYGSVYDIPWPDHRYDLVTGQAILHHVRDKALCAREIHRVLKADGLAVFKEPLGNSPWLERLRLLVPVPSEAPEDPEHWKDQMKLRELVAFGPFFAVSWRAFHLFSRIDRVLRSPRLVATIAGVDMLLLERLPFLRRYAREIVIELRPRTQDGSL